MDGRLQLLYVLTLTRDLLSRPGNDFVWSRWNTAAEAISEIDRYIAELKTGGTVSQPEMVCLYAPTGELQEVSLSSGWADEFLKLAALFDEAVARSDLV